MQQANDGTIIFRSISVGGTVVGVQLGAVNSNWTSAENVGSGIVVTVPVVDINVQGVPTISQIVANASISLSQSLPQELS